MKRYFYKSLMLLPCLLMFISSYAQGPTKTRGSFTLFFEDIDQNTNFGFDDNTSIPTHPSGATTLGELRIETFYRVIDYIESVIDVGNASPKITIKVSMYDAGSQVYGFAQAYTEPAKETQSIIYSGKLHEHITTGTDPDPNNPDAFITFNFGKDYNSDYLVTTLGVTDRDLITIALHELSHALGMYSLINSSGNSKLSGNKYGPFTHWDQFLYKGTTALVTTTASGFETSSVSYTDNDIVYTNTNNSTSFSVLSSDGQALSNLSHLDRYRDNATNYVMQASTDIAPVREYDNAEIEILCNIGYTIKGDRFTKPYGCGNDFFAVGVNDVYNNPTIGQWITYDILANDIDLDNDPIMIDKSYGDNGLLLVTGSDVNYYIGSDNKLNVRIPTNFCGDILFYYRPMDANTGRTGKVATVLINLPCTSCPDDPCGYICNGGFEDGISLPVFETILSVHYDFWGPHPIPSFVPFWWSNSSNYSTPNSPDLFIRGSQKANSRNAVAVLNPDSYSGAPYNNRYAAMFWNSNSNSNNEFLVTENIPSTGPGPFELSFEAYVNNSQTTTTNPTIRVYIDDDAGFNDPLDNTPALLAASFPVTTYDNWVNYNQSNFYGLSGSYFLFFTIDGPANSGNGRFYLDEISLKKPEPQLVITKTADVEEVIPGGTITYTITVCNESDVSASNIVINDILPAGLTVVGTNPLDASGNYTITGPLTANGTQCYSFDIDVQVDPNATCSYITNCATITSSSPASGCARNNDCVDVLITQSNACSCYENNSTPVFKTFDCGTSVDLDIFNTCSGGTWKDENNNDVNSTFIATTSGTYTYTGTDANGCECITRLRINVRQPEVQTKFIEICEPTMILPPSLCDQTGAISWDWVINNTPPVSSADPNGSMELSPGDQATVTTYYSNGCACTSIINATGILYPVSTESTTKCYQEVFELAPFVIPIEPNQTIKWDGEESTDITRIYIALQSFTTVAELYNEYGCVIFRKTYNITVAPEATTTNLPPQNITCGTGAPLTPPNCAPPAVNGYWSHLGSGATQPILEFPTENTTYTYICYDVNGCPVKITNYPVIVTPIPVTTQIEPLTICAGKGTILDPETIFGDLSGYTIEWPYDGTVSTSPTFTIYPEGDITITANIYNASGCLEKQVQYQITVTGNPIIVNHAKTICNDNCIELTPPNCPTGTTAMWLDLGNDENPRTVCPQESTIYQYVCVDGSGCYTRVNNYKITKVTINADPITIPLTICYPDCVTLDPYNNSQVQISGPTYIEWSTNETSPIIEYCTSEDATVTASIYEYGCLKYTVTYNITQKPGTGQASITNANETIECGECIDLTQYQCSSPYTIWPEGYTFDPVTNDPIYCPLDDEEIEVKCQNEGDECPYAITKVSVDVNQSAGTIYTTKVHIWLCQNQDYAPLYNCCGWGSNETYIWKDEYGNIVSKTQILPFQKSAMYGSPDPAHNFYLSTYDENGCLLCTCAYTINWVDNEHNLDETIIIELCPNDCYEFTVDDALHEGQLSDIYCGNVSFFRSGPPVVNELSSPNHTYGGAKYSICPPSLPYTTTFKYTAFNHNNYNEETYCFLGTTTLVFVEKQCKNGGSTYVNDVSNLNTTINIYPNPSTGVFTLELSGYNLSKTSYTIIDAVGREIMKIENIESDKSAVDMSKFEKGIYFIRVKQDGIIETKKIIIQ